MMTTIKKGDAAKAAMLAKFASLDWTVLLPWSEGERYDMVIDRGAGFERVQCKRGRLKNGAVMFECASVYKLNGKIVKRTYLKEEIDLYAVYCPDIGEHYLVPVEDAGRAVMSLRVAEPKPNTNGHPNLCWAAMYKL